MYKDAPLFKEIRWFENKTLVQNIWLEDEHQFVDLKSLFPSFQGAQICYWKFTLLSSKDSNFTISCLRESILNLIQTKFVLRKFVIYISWTCTWTTSIKEGVINYKCDLWVTSKKFSMGQFNMERMALRLFPDRCFPDRRFPEFGLIPTIA